MFLVVQEKFQEVFGTPTKSSNMYYLRKKLLRADGGSMDDDKDLPRRSKYRKVSTLSAVFASPSRMQAFGIQSQVGGYEAH